ncbi:Bug family tripartite tricarboxylate transporter substrate binding protein [Variovorax boronicumulans]|nr:tripartite tricarboxylate transporter substrate binding protein [Variovorax boronicumulans]
MMKTRRQWFAAALLCAATCFNGHASEPAHLDRPVTIVVAYPSGGDTDALARLLAEKLSVRLKQPVIVDNRPGASGVIGSSYVAKAPADGHVLLLAPSTFSIAQWVLKTGAGNGYDVLNGFTPVIELASVSLFLVAGEQAGLKSVAQAMAAAKVRPMVYASPGAGSPMHILGEMLNRAAKVRIDHVPYKGVAPAVSDLVGGHVPLSYVTLGSVAPHVATGKIRVLAVADPQRSPLAPDVPTLRELGYRDVEMRAWYGLFAPKGTKAETVRALNAHLNEILRLPDVASRIATLGAVAVGGPAEVLGKTNAGDFERFGRIVQELGIRAE